MNMYMIWESKNNIYQYIYLFLFFAEEEPFPADDEEDSPFGNKGGLFSGSKGLFDDSEEDEVIHLILMKGGLSPQ